MTSKPGPMLTAARKAVDALGAYLTTADEPLTVQYLVTARNIDSRGATAPDALFRRHEETYDRLIALVAQRRDAEALAESVPTFEFPWEDVEDWYLFVSHDHLVQMRAMMAERDAHLAALRALMVEPEAEAQRRVEEELRDWQARFGADAEGAGA